MNGNQKTNTRYFSAPKPSKSSEFTTLAQNSENSPQLSLECPLLNLNLPPVTDMDHNIQNCFCYMCKCGKHKCPGDYHSKNLNHSSHFLTNYKLHYKKKVVVPVKFSKQEFSYKQPSFSTDLKSINQSTYVPHELQSIKKTVPETHQNSNFKFRGKSTYSLEYPN